MIHCTESDAFNHRLNRRQIHCDFNGGDVSGNGGVMLVNLAERKLGVVKGIAAALHDPRKQSRVKYSLNALLRQRVFAIAAGYRDLNDHDDLRNGAAFQSAVGSMETLASPATLCRLESRAQRQCIFDMYRVLLDQFIAAHDEPPTALILDVDGTDDRVHGEQQER